MSGDTYAIKRSQAITQSFGLESRVRNLNRGVGGLQAESKSEVNLVTHIINDQGWNLAKKNPLVILTDHMSCRRERGCLGWQQTQNHIDSYQRIFLKNSKFLTFLLVKFVCALDGHKLPDSLILTSDGREGSPAFFGCESSPVAFFFCHLIQSCTYLQLSLNTTDYRKVEVKMVQEQRH